MLGNTWQQSCCSLGCEPWRRGLSFAKGIFVSQAKIRAWNTKAQRDLLQPNFVQTSSKGVSSTVDNPCEILPKSSQHPSKNHSNSFQNYLKSFRRQNNKFGLQHEPKPEHAWSCECAAAVAAAAAGPWPTSVWQMPWPIPWLDQGHGQCPGQCLGLVRALASGAL